MNHRRVIEPRAKCVAVVGLAVAVSAAAVRASTGTENILLNFGSGATAAHTAAEFLVDRSGNLFAPSPSSGTISAGTVFELSPGSGGSWGPTVLWDFASYSGALVPYGGLVADAAGNLYGTTQGGGIGGRGTVFELQRPTGQRHRWQETVLYDFDATHGANPYGSLLIDAKGNLYGTTFDGGRKCGPFHSTCGVVFEVSPPRRAGGTWQTRVLHAFAGHGDGFAPYAGLVADGAGNLYGTTIDGGAFGYKGGMEAAAARKQGPMRPRPPLPIGVDEGGTVFQLRPPSSRNGRWKESVLHSFGGTTSDGIWPYGRLLQASNGVLYGTTNTGGTNIGCGFGNESCGIVFAVTPPSSGGGLWTEQVIFDFPAGGGGGFSSFAGLIVDASGNLYGTTSLGGPGPYQNPCAYGCGTVFELSPPIGSGQWTESLPYSFRINSNDGYNPMAALAFDAAGNLVGTTPFGGPQDNGVAFEIVPGARWAAYESRLQPLTKPM